MSKARALGLILFGLSSFLVSCGDGEGVAKRQLLPAEEKKLDLTAEMQRVRDMQKVRVLKHDGPNLDNWLEMDVGSLQGAAVALVGVLEELCGGSTAANAGGNCDADIERDVGNLCVAEALLAASKVRAEPFQIIARDADPSNPGASPYLLIPQQSHATNVAMLRAALQYAIVVVKPHNINQYFEYYSACSASELSDPNSARSDDIVAALTRVYDLASEAVDLAVDNILAVSDAERSSLLSHESGNRRAWIAADLSRLAAAQLLVGGWVSADNTDGNVGEPLDFQAGFCPARPLSPQGQRALALLRAAAPPPAWLFGSTIALEEILDGDLESSLAGGGSVGQRLADMYHDSTLASGDVAAHFGLQKSDFEDARKYLADEMHAFGREPSVTLPAMPGGFYEPYVAVRVPPRETPDAFYAALAVGLGGDKAARRRESLSEFKHFAHWASIRARETANLSGMTDTAKTKFLGATHALDGGNSGRRDELRIDWDTSSSLFSIELRVSLSSSEFEHRLMYGEKGLHCATDGMIEGRHCDDTDLEDSTVAVLDNSGIDHQLLCVNEQGPTCFAWQQDLSAQGRVFDFENARLYVVRQKVAGDSAVGAFVVEAVAQVRGEGSRGSGLSYANVEDYAKVARILRPSRQSCDHPMHSCSGVLFDERLPLEDELVNDSNGVESSWKHYLDLAKQATQESDDLGSAYVNTSLEVDKYTSEESIRLEQKRQQLNGIFERVQNTCGTTADPQALLNLISGKAGGTCASNSDCLGARLVCISGKCVTGTRTCAVDGDCGQFASCISDACIPNLDALAASNTQELDPDVSRLLKCIDGGSYRFVALGDKSLCVQHDNNSYCTQGSSVQSPCPRLESDASACEDDAHIFVPTEDPEGTYGARALSLFHVKDSGSDMNDVCGAIQELRDGSEDPDAALAKLQNSKIFLPENVIDTAKRIGFEARLGAYAAVTLDGTTVFQTGQLGAPNYGQWPCAPKVGGSNPAPDTTLALNRNKALWPPVLEPPAVPTAASSKVIDCDNPTQRGAVNDRLMRAVILARFVGGNPHGANLRLPGVAIDISPQASALGSRELADASGYGGSVSENDINLDGVDAKVYVTNDQSALAIPAYVSLLGGQLQNLWVQGKYRDSRGEYNSWFALGNFTVDVNGAGWINVSPTDEQVNYVIDPANFLMNTGLNTSLLPGVDISTLRSFSNVSPGQWFRKLSTAIVPSEGEKPADGWYSDQLDKLKKGIPLQSLPGHLFHWSEGYHAYPSYDPVEFTPGGMLDAMELLCRARVAATSGIRPNPNHVPTVTSAKDLPQIKAYMDEVAMRIEDWAARFVIPNFPKAAADFLRQESNSGVVPALGGTYATTMTTLRADLIDLAQVAPLMAYELRQLGVAVDQARIATSQVDLTEQLQELQFASTMANNAASCAGAMTDTASMALSFGGSAAVACANAIVQSIIAAKQLNVQKQQDDLQKQAALASFQEQLNTHAQALQSYADRISKALEGIDGMIAELERQRLDAKRALAEAIRVAGFIPANTENIGATLAHQRETARLRYERAFQNAKLMADLAKRAIEQRLGIQLSQMTYDLPLVEAPQSWEGTVCDRSGIDWDKVRSNNPKVPDNFADAYIGDYVSKLERVVESYRLDHGFHEGSDTAVISMRDDVLNVRAPCGVKSKNLLLHSNDLNAPAAADGTGGWLASNCVPRSDAFGERAAPRNCVSAQPLDERVAPEMSDMGGIRPFRLLAGKAARTTCTSEPRECDYQPGARWGQRVHLLAGRYNLSYFRPEESDVPNRATAKVFTASGAEVAPDNPDDPGAPGGFYFGVTSVGTARTWRQHYAMFTVQQEGDFDIAFEPIDMSVTGEPGLLAAPMLESHPLAIAEKDWRPGTVVTTTSTNLLSLRQCEDTNGDYFHQDWQSGEIPLCPDGFSGTCNREQTTIHRYWEIPFSINQRDIESGRILSKAGFALGNFNYRIESIGVNFVGTGVKNCANSDSPTTCYSNGSVQYTLDHVGPYYVRNHEGGSYESKLFTGHIEHARGLAAERYITNPISSTDQQLMSDYMRSELQGRPLDGNFILRLWEAPGMYFDGIKDIQIVLKYRYWTRFD